MTKVEAKFVGAWKLIAFEELGSSGETRTPYGTDPVGLLIYDATGLMSVQIMKRDRGSTDEKLENSAVATEGFTAFFGTYQVDALAAVVTHHVEGHLLPQSVGESLRRTFEFVDDLLILRPTPDRRITWKRVTVEGGT